MCNLQLATASFAENLLHCAAPRHRAHARVCLSCARRAQHIHYDSMLYSVEHVCVPPSILCCCCYLCMHSKSSVLSVALHRRRQQNKIRIQFFPLYSRSPTLSFIAQSFLFCVCVFVCSSDFGRYINYVYVRCGRAGRRAKGVVRL